MFLESLKVQKCKGEAGKEITRKKYCLRSSSNNSFIFFNWIISFELQSCQSNHHSNTRLPIFPIMKMLEGEKQTKNAQPSQVKRGNHQQGGHCKPFSEIVGGGWVGHPASQEISATPLEGAVQVGNTQCISSGSSNPHLLVQVSWTHALVHLGGKKHYHRQCRIQPGCQAS